MKLLTRIDSAISNTVLDDKAGQTIDIDELVDKIVTVIKEKQSKNGRLFFIGNGGSAAIAVHMTADFLKNGGVTTLSMYDPATLTCLGNDYGYEYVFSKQLEMHIRENDLLIVISSSGNSQNIVNAIDVAHERQAEVVSLTGFKPDNKARKMADYSVYVPVNEYGIVESVHNLILQEVVDRIGLS